LSLPAISTAITAQSEGQYRESALSSRPPAKQALLLCNVYSLPTLQMDLPAAIIQQQQQKYFMGLYISWYVKWYVEEMQK
jgi:hypothetical protein